MAILIYGKNLQNLKLRRTEWKETKLCALDKDKNTTVKKCKLRYSTLKEESSTKVEHFVSIILCMKF